MNDKYHEMLSELRTQMAEEYKTVRKSVNRPAWPQLMITKGRSRTEYLAVTYKDGKRIKRHINKEPGQIYRLAHKAYMKEYALRLRADMEVINAAVKAMQSLDYRSILNALPKHFDLLDPERVMIPGKGAGERFYPNPSADAFPVEARLEFGGTDPWEWAAEPYRENTDHPEHKTHLTRSGLYCRSKSEALIFEIYMSLGLPFHYDETITIGGQRLSPDFIGVRRDGRFVYHEHCGLSSEQYRARNDWKSGLYAAADIFPGDNLIYTYDDPNGNINARLAEALIRDAYKL